MTVDQALRIIAKRLSHDVASERPKSQIENPLLEAEILLSHLLNMERWQLKTRGSKLIEPDLYSQLETLAARRLEGEPLAYLLGVKEFWSREFLVSSSTLIPRPETELLVERAISLCPDKNNPFILDAGTGSGIIAITLALELPGALIVATDISFDALCTAKQNLNKYADEISDNSSRIFFVNSDWLGGIKKSPSFDIVVSNPPYIGTQEAELLAPDVIRYEPRQALFAGSSGLDAIKELLGTVPDVLCPEGWFLCEIGYLQGEDVLEMARKSGRYDSCKIEKDLAGMDRMLVASKKASKKGNEPLTRHHSL